MPRGGRHLLLPHRHQRVRLQRVRGPWSAPVQISGGQQVQIPGPTAAAIRQLTATVTASQAHTLDSFKIGSAFALGLITILSFGLSWWMAGRALRPVHRITDAARRLSEQTLHSRINLKGPNDELKELADTFDAMLGRLDRAFTSQRRFVANASHELRTPLATERVLIDEALANRSARPEDFRVHPGGAAGQQRGNRTADRRPTRPGPLRARHRALVGRRPGRRCRSRPSRRRPRSGPKRESRSAPT